MIDEREYFMDDIKDNTEQNILAEMEKDGALCIEPIRVAPDLTDTSRFAKLDLSAAEKRQISHMFSQVPAIASAAAMSQMYTLSFPSGVVGSLMQYASGGVGSSIMGANGIIGHAAFFSAGGQAAVLGVFSAMALISGQYFMKQINDELKLINQKLDEILGFLYGDKKAELLSEINFTKRT